MTSHIQYALNSGAWFLGGCIVSSIYWRAYYHRRMRADGTAKPETGLGVFTAGLVVLVTLGSVLLAESARIGEANYEQCQAQVNQQFRDGYQDRVKIAAQDVRPWTTCFAASCPAHSTPPPCAPSCGCTSTTGPRTTGLEHSTGRGAGQLHPAVGCEQLLVTTARASERRSPAASSSEREPRDTRRPVRARRPRQEAGPQRPP